LKTLSRHLGKHVSGVAPDVLRLFEAFPWPGNVRQLQSALRYASIQSAGELITMDCLPNELLEPAAGTVQAPPTEPEVTLVDVAEFVCNLLRTNESDVYDKVNAAVDRVVMQTVLRHVKGSQVQAAEILGISRTTLRTKLRALGLAIEKQLFSESGQPG
jgi:DNA-binding NtrC family response regulator